MAVDFKLNGRPVSVDVPDGTRIAERALAAL